MIITWRAQTGFGWPVIGLDIVHVWSGRNAAPTPPPTTGGIEQKIVIDFQSGINVKSTPNLGGIGGTGIQ